MVGTLSGWAGTWETSTTGIDGRTFNSASASCLLMALSRNKKIAIWAIIVGGGLAYYFAYGHIADLMR